MAIENLGIMIDCSRDAVINKESLFRFIDIISKMGYNSLQLYIEDIYEIKDNKYFGYMRGKYSIYELKEFDEYAKYKGIELIPCIQTLAHLKTLFRWKCFQDLNDYDDILLSNYDKTYNFIDELLKNIRSAFSSNKIHLGMDESHMIGLGKYLDKFGYQNRSDIFVKHLNKVVEIAKKYNFSPMIWSDMFFRLANNGSYYGDNIKVSQKIKDLVPKDVSLVYWDYYHLKENDYSKMIKGHLHFNNKIIFAGGAWSWTGFVPHNNYSIEASKKALKACEKYGINDAFITLWGDNGKECSFFSLLPTLMCFAEFAKGNFDMKIIKEKFKQIVKIDFVDFMILDLPDSGNNNKLNYTNPSKYLLYNDLFSGIYDSTVWDGMNKYFKRVSNRLNKMKNSEGFGYLFDVEKKLCDVLSIKSELGIITRKFYKEGNKKALQELIRKDYTMLIKKLDLFYQSFRYLWEKENKLFGFEIHDARLGGLMQRIKNQKRILQDYIDNKIAKISILDEEILDYSGNEKHQKEQIVCNDWKNIVSTNLI